MNQKLIKKIETKIKVVTTLIQAQKEELTKHENIVLALIEELSKVKDQISKKNNKKPWK